jgi:hypothetical protein
VRQAVVSVVGKGKEDVCQGRRERIMVILLLVSKTAYHGKENTGCQGQATSVVIKSITLDSHLAV